MDQLQLFYENKSMYEAVRAFFSERLREKAIELLMERKDATHLADAQEALDDAFSLLKENFEPKKVPNITNHAR